VNPDAEVRASACAGAAGGETAALAIRVTGLVRGVGFNPYIFRLAVARAVGGWVAADEDGVTIHIEGAQDGVDGFIADLRSQAPVASRISGLEIAPAAVETCRYFQIRPRQ
jgi:hydrogenase maturation protein HypF